MVLDSLCRQMTSVAIGIGYSVTIKTVMKVLYNFIYMWKNEEEEEIYFKSIGLSALGQYKTYNTYVKSNFCC